MTARLAAAALLPFAAVGAPLGAAGLRRITVPAGQYNVERVLVRELSDGAQIVVTRRWLIAFAAEPEGSRVSGEQVFCEVAAPAKLAPLAAIEKARSTAGMFPLNLDAGGRLTSSGPSSDSASLLRAIEAGQAMVALRASGPGMASDAKAFMTQLTQIGAEAVSTLPRDLFFPAPGHSETTREIALPGGETGQLSLSTAVSVSPGSGLLSASERVIVTRIGASERLSKEGWSLHLS